MNTDFIKYQAQTSPYPLGMEVSHAIGSYIYDTNNKKYLDFEISGEQLSHSKPFPDIYLKASEVLDVKPDECIVIEDSRIGIEAGKNANMFVIAYKDEKFKQDQSKASIAFSSMKEISDYIDNLI